MGYLKYLEIVASLDSFFIVQNVKYIEIEKSFHKV